MIALGYVGRFIFETAKISQLFCHQIIWNMRANCFKDDAADVVSAQAVCLMCDSSELRRTPSNLSWMKSWTRL